MPIAAFAKLSIWFEDLEKSSEIGQESLYDVRPGLLD